ncbi:hypothetical protein P3T76_008084 [Phytophthora citrophthora]|uniref:Uncharacterized protein n=1 Tax=Phytophthora citrophthora TaxID=4793 RepID=A0AAD9GLW2_9STRA|nr:hypothetical protein P3T76_008084 [Phytophthora citrophthora]
MPSALMIANRTPQRINGYTGVIATGTSTQYWANSQTRYPTYRTFYNEVNNYNRVHMPTRRPILPLTDDDDRKLRELVAVNDGLDEISYPIATIDTCDCVSYPDTILMVSECSGDAYWGTFQLKLTDGSCYDVSFDDTLVYQNCPSNAYPEYVTEYVLCEVDFTEGTDSSDYAYDTTESETETTSTSNLRQEETGGTKKTHVHFSVHRLLSLVLEGLFALQYPA